MAGKAGGVGGWPGGVRLRGYNFLEDVKLAVGKYEQKGLKKDNRLTQAGVEVVVDSIENEPIVGGGGGGAYCEIFGGFVETFGEIRHHFL